MIEIISGNVSGMLEDHDGGGQSRPHKAVLCRASNANLIIAPAASLGDVS
jgi:hypothetical protein